MGEKEINIGKHIKLTMMKHYKEWKQLILGVTINAEEETFASNSLYNDILLKRTKYEFNIWLFLISFHITVYGKMNKTNE